MPIIKEDRRLYKFDDSIIIYIFYDTLPEKSADQKVSVAV
jgi:hypothetical protein